MSGLGSSRTYSVSRVVTLRKPHNYDKSKTSKKRRRTVVRPRGTTTESHQCSPVEPFVSVLCPRGAPQVSSEHLPNDQWFYFRQEKSKVSDKSRSTRITVLTLTFGLLNDLRSEENFRRFGNDSVTFLSTTLEKR